MTKRWGVVGAIVCGMAAIAGGCVGSDPEPGGAVDESGARASAGEDASEGGDCQEGTCLPAIPEGRCLFGEGCFGLCIYPLDGCDPATDETCLGFCVDPGQCIADDACAGGALCLDCGGSTDLAECSVICDPPGDTQIEPEPDPLPEPETQTEPETPPPSGHTQCDKNSQPGGSQGGGTQDGGDGGAQDGGDGGSQDGGDGGSQDGGDGEQEPPHLQDSIEIR